MVISNSVVSFFVRCRCLRAKRHCSEQSLSGIQGHGSTFNTEKLRRLPMGSSAECCNRAQAASAAVEQHPAAVAEVSPHILLRHLRPHPKSRKVEVEGEAVELVMTMNQQRHARHLGDTTHQGTRQQRARRVVAVVVAQEVGVELLRGDASVVEEVAALWLMVRGQDGRRVLHSAVVVLSKIHLAPAAEVSLLLHTYT